MVTKFQDKIYKKLKTVPKGKVTTYKALAKAVNSKAYRAVGTAMAKNPYSVWGRAGGKSCRRQQEIVPCHRVINSDGSIGNYSGKGGNKTKIQMLRKEGVKIINNKVDLKRYLFKI